MCHDTCRPFTLYQPFSGSGDGTLQLQHKCTIFDHACMSHILHVPGIHVHVHVILPLLDASCVLHIMLHAMFPCMTVPACWNALLLNLVVACCMACFTEFILCAACMSRCSCLCSLGAAARHETCVVCFLPAACLHVKLILRHGLSHGVLPC